MKQEPHKDQFDVFGWMTLAGTWLMAINQSLAVPWMAATSWLGSFGSRFLGMNAVLAMSVIYAVFPLWVEFKSREQMVLYSRAWYFLGGLILVQWVASKVMGGRKHLHQVGVCMLGFWGELFALGVVVWGLSLACPPLAALMGASYLAKRFLFLTIDWRYARIRDAIESQKLDGEEVQRVMRG